jgi:hypothetical protein
MTGNTTGDMISNMSSNEAWINYGHLLLPNNLATPTYYAPGQADTSAADTNANNFYADQWLLGRVPILLRTPTGTPAAINDNGGNAQEFIADSGGLTPLAYSSTGNGFDIYASRYDLAATSIDAFRNKVISAINVPNPTWWQALAYSTGTNPYRFQCDPYSVLARATFSNAAMAQTFPYFLKGCTQFMVEFAGDFTTQSTTGTPTSYVPDGVTDFYIDATTSARNIQWYGMYRDFNGNGAYDPGDVVPLANITGTPTQQPYEKVLPTAAAPQYLCVFAPSDPKPTMLRITIALTDPGNRLANPQTYEYVLGTP